MDPLPKINGSAWILYQMVVPGSFNGSAWILYQTVVHGSFTNIMVWYSERGVHLPNAWYRDQTKINGS